MTGNFIIMMRDLYNMTGCPVSFTHSVSISDFFYYFTMEKQKMTLTDLKKRI